MTVAAVRGAIPTGWDGFMLTWRALAAFLGSQGERPPRPDLHQELTETRGSSAIMEEIRRRRDRREGRWARR